MGQGAEDSVMSVWTMPSQASWCSPHGTEGSIFGRGIMTQKPVGEVELVDASGHQAIPFEVHNLYTRSLGLGRLHRAVHRLCLRAALRKGTDVR